MAIHPALGMSLTSLLCTSALAFLLRSMLATPHPRLISIMRGYQSRLEIDLRFARIEITASTVIGLQVLTGLCATFAATQHLLLVLCFAALSISPRLLLARARQRRVQALEKQIEGWLNSLAQALDAAPSIGDALEVSANACEAPLNEELEVLVNEIHLGRPLDRTLSAWAKRVDSQTLTIALTTLQVGRETGGRLGEVLRSSANSLREMERLEGVVRTKTAEGKAQAMVISALPVPLYFAIKAGDPHYFTPLEGTPAGQILVAAAVGLWLAAGFVARKILTVQI